MQVDGNATTFLCTDVAGSTALWEECADDIRAAMARRDDLIEEAVRAAGGTVVRPRGEGGSCFAVFPAPAVAVVAAVDIVRSLSAERWRTAAPISVAPPYTPDRPSTGTATTTGRT